MASEKPLLYVILGAAGSGRREVLADLIEGGLGEGERASVLLPATEPAHAGDAALPGVARWSWSEGALQGAWADGASHVFFLADGRANPVDLLEAMPAWLAASGAELARIITVVNCSLAERHPALLAWYEACIHFSDIALLNQREGVANKWLSDFRARFKDLCLPCLFELVKAGRVKNPLVVLDPQARRMSHLFDIDDWTGVDIEGIEFGEEGDEDFDDPDEKPSKAAPKKDKKKDADEDEEDDWKPQIDPYLELDAAGRRKRALPDIAAFLDPSR